MIGQKIANLMSFTVSFLEKGEIVSGSELSVPVGLFVFRKRTADGTAGCLWHHSWKVQLCRL